MKKLFIAVLLFASFGFTYSPNLVNKTGNAATMTIDVPAGTTVVTFTFQTTDLTVIQPILCANAGLANTPANAKQAIILWVLSQYQASLVNSGAATAQAQAQAIIQANIITAQNTANAVVIQ